MFRHMEQPADHAPPSDRHSSRTTTSNSPVSPTISKDNTAGNSQRRSKLLAVLGAKISRDRNRHDLLHQNHVNATTMTAGIKNGSASPHVPEFRHSPFESPQPGAWHPSLSSVQSQVYAYGIEEAKEKQLCLHPDCGGKAYVDLKAHRLTHQIHSRLEKCPIATCDYHTKGFVRRFDRDRHTLTHYKGTIVCGFCPGSGPENERSFSGAKAFKHHLSARHGGIRPPSSREALISAKSGEKPTRYAPDVTRECSACFSPFSDAQALYEHVDGCILRIVEQEEELNARRLAEVENNRKV